MPDDADVDRAAGRAACRGVALPCPLCARGDDGAADDAEDAGLRRAVLAVPGVFGDLAPDPAEADPRPVVGAPDRGVVRVPAAARGVRPGV
ncbi:hypothetical protein DFJ68_0587 [Terracoccus luteus]|uniref:Uncharacterized protein n=1 Tax=Terracoccus luteus TaxID=53356 RepID=A0A495XRJ4_9MICO|nr:hypothetical protein [Terracoccus luteus]RKT77171.1 hypothetical protein DFJ68_0587 [Terracoccus luteus]